jgi:hypothetical protein
MVVGLGAMFESARSAPHAGDLSLVGCDAKADTTAETLARTCVKLAVRVFLAQTSRVGDNGHDGGQVSGANATGPSLDAVDAIESVGEAIGPACRIFVRANRCSGNGVESPAVSTACE